MHVQQEEINKARAKNQKFQIRNCIPNNEKEI